MKKSSKLGVYRVRASYPSIQVHPFHHLSIESRIILRAGARRETRVTIRRPSIRKWGLLQHHMMRIRDDSWESQPTLLVGFLLA